MKKQVPDFENAAIVKTPPVVSPLTVVGTVLDSAPDTHWRLWSTDWKSSIVAGRESLWSENTTRPDGSATRSDDCAARSCARLRAPRKVGNAIANKIPM